MIDLARSLFQSPVDLRHCVPARGHAELHPSQVIAPKRPLRQEGDRVTLLDRREDLGTAKHDEGQGESAAATTRVTTT